MRRFFLQLTLLLTAGTLSAQFSAPVSIFNVERKRFEAVEAAVDLNNDSLPDLLVVDLDRKLYLYWNLGQNKLSEAELLTDSLGFRERVLAVDLNMDGARDIVYRSTEDGLLATRQLRNDPSNQGNFTRESLPGTVPSRTLDLAGDFDGDGAPDLIVRRAPGSYLDTVYLHRNNGQGGFEIEQMLPSDFEALATSNLRAKDVDGDEDLDLLFQNGKILGYWENTANGQLLSQKVITEITSVGNFEYEPGDFNGDGQSDLLVVRPAGQWGSFARAYMNRGPDGFERIDLYPETNDNSTWFPYLTGDFSGDGIEDILVRKNSLFTILQYTQEGIFVEIGASETDPESNQNGLAVDWDNDGTLDVLAIRPGAIALIPGRNDGTFSAVILINPEVASIAAVGHADLDRDGDEDVFFASWIDNRVAWKSNEGSGNFSETKLISSNLNFPNTIFASDLDQNGYIDLVVSGFDRIVTGFYNQGGGQFSEGVELVPGRLKAPPVDLDNDELPDLLVQSYSDSLIYWSRNNGSGFDPPLQALFPSDLASSPLIFHDIDQDGDQDLFTVVDEFAFWMSNTPGLEFSIINIFEGISGYTDLQIGDLDNNSRPDLIYSTSPQQILWASYDGSVAAQVIADEESCPLNISLADFDNDGDQDIVGTAGTNAPCAGLYNTVFFKNQGDSTFVRTNFAVDLESLPSDIYAIEIDGDGRMDLLTYDGQEISWWKNILDAPAVSGYAFWDQNANGERELEEPLLPGIDIEMSPSPLLTFTDQDGYFRFYLDTGAYTVSIDQSPCWELTGDSAGYHFTVGDNTPDFFAFGLQPKDNTRRLSAVLTTAPTRCNTDIPAWLSISNDGCVPVSGKVSLTLDDLTGLAFAPIPPDAQNGDTLSWEIDTLLPAETQTIPLLLWVAGPEFLGDSVRLSYTPFWPDQTGQLVAGASSQLVSELLCAYDPNDKLVDKTSIPKAYDAAEGTLRYTIRFQNTGNDTAFNVRLYDQLSTDLDWTSLKPISASHPYVLQLDRATGELELFFRNILLPDSTTNEPGSHGYATFSIQMQPGLLPGTVLENQAEIYFDANPPILTNITETMIPQVTLSSELKASRSIRLFPNPTTGRLTAQLPDKDLLALQVEVFDLLGRSVMRLEVQSSSLDISPLPSGVYILRLQWKEQVWSQKVLKN